jgi:hypothetical protein
LIPKLVQICDIRDFRQKNSTAKQNVLKLSDSIRIDIRGAFSLQGYEFEYEKDPESTIIYFPKANPRTNPKAPNGYSDTDKVLKDRQEIVRQMEEYIKPPIHHEDSEDAWDSVDL